MNETRKRYQRVSWHQVERMVAKLADAVIASPHRPDVIVAIARGGYVPARLLCDLLDVHLLGDMRIEHYAAGERLPAARLTTPLDIDVSGRHVLIIDDVADSGETLRLAAEHVASRKPASVRIGVLIYKPSSDFRPHLWASRPRRWCWNIFPWALHEDVTGLIRTLSNADNDPEQLRRQLLEAYDLRLSLATLAGILRYH